ncbi:metal ABC transporter ATP-binding protein [uncultured Friedmanniella sp.]|uniref:metal ABC transporter ATP-binding protein n=1 Tax=uncultured Friedmanniella sp. TaxID=335381 RepID=UPI0035CACC97
MAVLTETVSSPVSEPPPPLLSVRNATLRFGERTLWSGLDLEVRRGEFIAVLGPNGSGKTSLMRAILGTQALSEGSIEILGQPVRRGSAQVGYVPQQQLADRGTPLRARDFVGLGLNGHRFGVPLPSRARRRAVDATLETVQASHLARRRIGDLSGGEQQRLRIGQALIGDSRLLLCDEPLISLDLYQQRAVSTLIDASRRDADRAVLMITHDINPVLDVVDRVVYLAEGQVRTGRVDEVLTSEVLSELYRTPVDVIRARGRIIVVGLPDGAHEGHEAHPRGGLEA